jgi:hypothetical protein
MNNETLKLILNALEISVNDKNLQKIIDAYELVKLKEGTVTIDDIKKLKE